MTGALTSAYEPTYRRSIDEPEAFWAEVGEGIAWERRWDRVLDDRRCPALPLVRRGPS
jgi:propionyl-CoA synthetase